MQLEVRDIGQLRKPAAMKTRCYRKTHEKIELLEEGRLGEHSASSESLKALIHFGLLERFGNTRNDIRIPEFSIDC